MGGNVPEEYDPRPQPLGNRNVWAIDVLIEEVKALFDTKVETSEPNWLNANTVVDFTTDDEDEWVDMALVFPVLEDDERIESVVADGQARVITVRVVANAVLYDTREPFGLDSAVLGLDRELTPDDLTPIAADIASGAEGFTEGTL